MSLDSTETFGDFSMVGGTGKATVEVSGTASTASGSSLTIGKGGELKAVEGGSATFNAPAKLTIRDGGKLKVTGGEVKIERPVAFDCNSSSGTSSSIETEGGSLQITVADSSHRFTTGSGFTLGGSGGRMTFAGTGNWYQTLVHAKGMDTNRFSGTAELKLTNATTSIAFASNGRYEFTDNARLFLNLYSAPCCFMPYSDNHALEFEFKDHAGIGNYGLRDHGRLVLGCPASTMASGVTRFVLDSDTEHYIRAITIGLERTSLGELIQKRGTVHVSYEGLSLGTCWEAYWIDGAANRGIYRMQGGVLDIYGGGTTDNKYGDYGLLVGWGMLDGYADHTQFTNYRHSGRFELNDGIVTNSVGIVAMGCGRADGELIQRGGEMVLGTLWAARGNTPGNHYPGLYLVGGFSGTGLWAVSNGVLKCMSSYEHTYVGGVDKETLRAHIRRVAQNKSDGSDVLPTCAADTEKAATGRLEAVDGTIVSSGDLIVGARGHGEVRLVGANGAVTYRNLVMSNNVESVARFVLDANGVKSLALTGSATITDGAKLVVDVSGFTGRRNNHPLITAAGGMTGTFPEVTLVGDNQAARLAMVEQNANGVRLVIQRGVTIILR